MRKVFKLFFGVFFFLTAVLAFPADFHGRSIYIEGTAEETEHEAFFQTNFSMEAIALGVVVAEHRDEAEFTVSFDVRGQADEYEPYVITLSLIENETDREMVSFAWSFARLEDMFRYNQFLLYMAVAPIPARQDEEALVQLVTRDDRWQRQRLYMRMSVDFSTVFYHVLPDGLIGRQGVFEGPQDAPSLVAPHEHSVFPQPGITVGFEWLFLNFMSLELNARGSMGDINDSRFLNLTADAQLKLVIRTRDFMVQPYGAFRTPVIISPEFHEFSRVALGGGIQISARGMGNGAWFVDLSFMRSIEDVLRYNPHALTPNPSIIHYQHFTFGIGIGHKFGFFGPR